MSASAEISDLRSEEAFIARESERLGRLQNRLMEAHPGNLVVVGYLPAGMWAELPDGWQGAVELRLSPRFGVPPVGIKGPVAVSEVCAETICRSAGV